MLRVSPKPTTNIKLNGKKLEAFALRSKARHECLHSPLLFNIILEILANAIRKEKEIKSILIAKKEIKLSLQLTYILQYIEE